MGSEPERVAQCTRDHRSGPKDRCRREGALVAGVRGAAGTDAEEGEGDVHAELVVAAGSH